MSCVDAEFGPRSQLEKELIFNKLNVDQPRGHFAYIQNHISFLDEENQNVSVGLASRSSGLATTRLCKEPNKQSFGSGSLSSSTNQDSYARFKITYSKSLFQFEL